DEPSTSQRSPKWNAAAHCCCQAHAPARISARICATPESSLCHRGGCKLMSQTYSHFINGTWREPDSGAYFASTNPANLEHLYDVARGDERDVHSAVTAARNAFYANAWANISQTKRGKLLRKLGDLIT